MAARRRNVQPNTGRTGGKKTGAGGFDKSTAVRIVEVPVAGQGVVSFPEMLTEAERVWVEWYPSAALGKEWRRCFLSKERVLDPSRILTGDGVQLPRKGKSCKLEDRVAVVFGPGKFKVWIQNERRQNQASATTEPLSSSLMSLVLGGQGVARPSSSQGPTASSRRAVG